MARNEVFALVDELTLILQNAKKVPLTDSALINQKQAVDMLKRILASYDPSLEKAAKIIQQQEDILNKASEAAQKTMSSAQTQATGMVNEANGYAQTTKANADAYVAETRRSAEEQANAMLADAQARAQHTLEDAKAQADELVSQTTVLARAEAQAQELLDNANQHAQAVRQQTQYDLTNMLEHVDATVSQHLNDLRIMKQNLTNVQSYEDAEGNDSQ